MSELGASDDWGELVADIAGQAHSSGVAVAAFVTGKAYHDNPDVEKCNGPSCQWYRKALTVIGHQLAEERERREEAEAAFRKALEALEVGKLVADLLRVTCRGEEEPAWAATSFDTLRRWNEVLKAIAEPRTGTVSTLGQPQESGRVRRMTTWRAVTYYSDRQETRIQASFLVADRPDVPGLVHKPLESVLTTEPMQSYELQAFADYLNTLEARLAEALRHAKALADALERIAYGWTNVPGAQTKTARVALKAFREFEAGGVRSALLSSSPDVMG